MMVHLLNSSLIETSFIISFAINTRNFKLKVSSIKYPYHLKATIASQRTV